MKKNELNIETNYLSLMEEKNSYCQNILTSFFMRYDCSFGNWVDSLMSEVKGKKECYIVLRGNFNQQDFGQVQFCKVFCSIKDVEKIMIDENEYLTHVWYFNYNKEKLKCIFGDWDEKIRVYMQLEDEKIYLHYPLGDFMEKGFDNIKEIVEFCNSKNLELYYSREHLEKFYQN